MAAALDPDEVLHSTAGKANFQRITRLLISGGTSLLREMFDAIHPPSNLPTILSNSATKKQLKTAKLTKPQWDCLYPSPGVYGKSVDFDVTLLFRLLRTICGLAPLTTGWDALPASTDHSLTADLARVKHYRNSIYGHVNQGMEIKDEEFPSFWQDISETLVRIAGQISLPKKTAWQGAIDNLLYDPLTVEDERNVEELEMWYKSDMEVKKSIEEVCERMNRLEEELKKTNVVIKKVQKEGEGIKEDLKTRTQDGMDMIETVVREEAQDITEKLKNTTREEAQNIKDQLGQIHRSIDRLSSSAATFQSAGARLSVRIDCEATESGSMQGGATGIIQAPQEPRAVLQGAAVVPLTSNQPQIVVTTGAQKEATGALASQDSKVVQGAAVVPVTLRQTQAVVTTGSGGVNVGNEGLPSGQEVLNFIAFKCFKEVDSSKPEELNGFLQYLKEVRKVLFVDAQSGSLIITVECGSVQILDELWEDYRTGHLNEMAQKFLVTEEILKELGLIAVKLTTTILREEYRVCREYLFAIRQEWREQYKSVEDEEKALAIALERSRIEYEAREVQAKLSEPPSESFSTICREEYQRQTCPGSEGDLLVPNVCKGTVTSSTRGNKAIPLCLPNNCEWNSQEREYKQTGIKSSSLYVVHDALEKLREVKGPVCVVSIAGPYRQGKSYILSEAFNQPAVFPLGHEIVAETMGIWLWIVPQKYKDSRGQEFTVVLLDSEGIDAATSDNQIFTLTVLLASVLIYNSQGVPTRHDLEGMEFIAKLSQRIHITSNQGFSATSRKETEFFHRTFPFFLWLLRDVTQAIPRDCKDLKEYFLKKVFRDQGPSPSSHRQGQEVAESILHFFAGFDAFHLPPPTADEEVMRTLNENKSQILSQFLTRLEHFKSLLISTLVPKHSCFDGQFVTGEGLAALVTLYVEAINTPGAIPNVQSAWETFVEAKCFDARNVSLQAYDARMESLLSNKFPCDNDEIRKGHNDALEECQRRFMAETTGMSTNTTEKHLRLLKESLTTKLKAWQTKNAQLTRERCNNLLCQLKKEHLDPVLQQLQGYDGTNLSFDDIIGVYHRIKDGYEREAVGAKDVIAATFFDFHPELTRETKHNLEILRRMKNFDDKAAQKIKLKAYQEQERKKLEEQQLCLQQENQEHKKEMEMLMARLDEERAGLRQQMHSELKAERLQMQNMIAASMRQAEQERQAYVRENQAMEERFLAIQKSNEENMRMIKDMAELIAKQDREKMDLQANLKELPKEEIEVILKEMSDKHADEVRAKLEKTDTHLEGIKKIKEQASDEEKENLEELPKMINSRSQAMGNLQRKIAETQKEEGFVEKLTSAMKTGLKVFSRIAPAAGKLVAAYAPETEPFEEPAAVVAADTANALSDVCCIM